MGRRGTVEAEPSETVGPTRTALGEPNSWERKPKLAALLRTAIALIPTATSFLVTFGIAKYLPPSSLGLHTWLWWIGLVSCGFASLLLVDRTLRQLLPLVALLRLSLIFPDQAPSRFSIALRTGTTRQLERRVKSITSSGLPDAPREQAEHLLELVAALSRHDRMTRGHCERVRAYTDLLADEMDLSVDDANKLRWAALAHDVGKIFVSAEILNSPDAPVGDAWEEIKSHTWLGDELVEPLRPWLGEWLDAVGQHHERWDGGGYPNGLSGERIHLGARIVAVADAFDVMTSRRSYKKPMSAKLARAEIAEKAGRQFDPDVARALMTISIGRLRFAVGPLTWLFNVPTATSAALTPVAAPVLTTVTAATTTLAAAAIGFAPVPEQPLALSDASSAIIIGPVVPDPLPTTTTVDPVGPSTTAPTTAPPTPAAPTTAPPTTATPTTAPPPTEPSTTAPSTTSAPTTAPPTTATPTTPPPPTTAPTTAPPPTAPPSPTTAPTTVPPTPPEPLLISFDPSSGTINEDGTAIFFFSIAAEGAAVEGVVSEAPSAGAIELVAVRDARQFSRTDERSAPSDEPLVGVEPSNFTATYTPDPDVAGTDQATLRFCSETGCADAVLNMTIAPLPDAPTIDPVPGPVVFTVGETVHLSVVATDADGDQITFAGSGLPDGIELDETTGIIAGTIDESATPGSITVTVTDDAEPALSSSLTFDYLVEAAPTPLPFEQTLVISAARHHSSPGPSIVDEFIDITNVSDAPVDLAGITLSDFATGSARDRRTLHGVEIDTSFVFTFPASDRNGRPSALAPGATARIWISEPCGTTYSIGDIVITTTPFPHDQPTALSFSIDEANWHRLELDGDDLWLRQHDGTLEDFVRWTAPGSAPSAQAPAWWIVEPDVEHAWATAGAGSVVRFDHDRSHRVT